MFYCRLVILLIEWMRQDSWCLFTRKESDRTVQIGLLYKQSWVQCLCWWWKKSYYMSVLILWKRRRHLWYLIWRNGVHLKNHVMKRAILLFFQEKVLGRRLWILPPPSLGHWSRRQETSAETATIDLSVSSDRRRGSNDDAHCDDKTRSFLLFL